MTWVVVVGSYGFVLIFQFHRFDGRMVLIQVMQKGLGLITVYIYIPTYIYQQGRTGKISVVNSPLRVSFAPESDAGSAKPNSKLRQTKAGSSICGFLGCDDPSPDVQATRWPHPPDSDNV